MLFRDRKLDLVGGSVPSLAKPVKHFCVGIRNDSGFVQ